MSVALTAYSGAFLFYVSYVLEMIIENFERNVENERV
jgi:hypothetical protein